MAMRERLYKHTDKPMTWTKAIVLGSIIWGLAILLVGQLPSYIIYSADTYVGQLIDFSKRIPGVSSEGLNSQQIKIVRDIVANTAQFGVLIVALAFAYFWQESKRKRTGTRGPTDTVKGYMSGK